MKRRVVAWVRLGTDGNPCTLSFYKDKCDEYGAGDPDMRTLKLVEADPRADAVVKAALKWRDDRHEEFWALRAGVDDTALALYRACERYLKGRK